MNKIYCTKIKAPSREKRDITIVVKDLELGAEPELGFSIKSQIGNPSTLLNAGQTTNFIYEVKNIRENQIEEINAIEGRSKIKDRLQKIKDLNGIAEYSSMQSQTFKNNMEIIDSSLPELIAEYVFSFFTDPSNKISDLTNDIISKDPLSIGNENKNAFYKNKIKHFLRSVSLGMTPTNSWDTNNEVTGGFIVVKKDGEILCYHIYNKEDFENYLYKNTKFDTASSGRHKFGLLYTDNDKIYLKLNLQIRFIT
jgi:type II restriction enzyme